MFYVNDKSIDKNKEEEYFISFEISIKDSGIGIES